jgi:drug/metabolite transporter (DMT)-like permease
VSPTAVALILVAAIAHASWNLFSKQASTTGAVFFVWLVAASGTVFYAPAVVADLLVQRPHLMAANWLFLAGTGVLQAGYFLFLQSGYRLGDLSLVYPIGRGTGALLAALAGIVLLGERPGAVGAAGIGCIVAGIVLIGIPGRRPERGGAADGRPEQPLPQPQSQPQPRSPTGGLAAAERASALKATIFAVVTGVFIASYTLWDKHAVSTLRTPPLLQGYAAFPAMLVAFLPLVLRDRQRLTGVWQSFRPQVLGAAILAPLAYILVLAALSFTAVSAVAPAREVSVLFGVLLGRRLLGEGSLPRRLAAAAAIVAGIVAVAVA